MTGKFEGDDSEVLRRERRRPPIDMLLDSLVVEREVRTADSANRTAKLLLGRSRWHRAVRRYVRPWSAVGRVVVDIGEETAAAAVGLKEGRKAEWARARCNGQKWTEQEVERDGVGMMAGGTATSMRLWSGCESILLKTLCPIQFFPFFPIISPLGQ